MCRHMGLVRAPVAVMRYLAALTPYTACMHHTAGFVGTSCTARLDQNMACPFEAQAALEVTFRHVAPAELLCFFACHSGMEPHTSTTVPLCVYAC